MAFDFPPGTTIGQTYGSYTWDGEKWTMKGGVPSVYVSDTAPAGAPIGALWWESDSGILFFNYNDGNTTQWVAITNSASAAVVLYTPQTLTAPQQAQARSNVGISQTVALAASQDLNAVQTPGSYYTIDNASINAPIVAAFLLEVFYTTAGPNNIVQRLMQAGTAITWQRLLATGVWQPWRMLLDTSAQTLTSETLPYGTTVGQRAQSRMNIYAAPFDALAYSGIQINGGGDVNQSLPIPVTGTQQYACDGWKLAATLTSGGVQMASVNPTGIANPGYPASVNVSVTTVPSPLGASDFVSSRQDIEGSRIMRLAWGTNNAQPITIGFWSCHTRTGQYSIALRNIPPTRGYHTSYTHNASNIWQYNTITVPGCTDGAWASDNTIGLAVFFTMAAGSANIAPSANAWLTVMLPAAPGQINGVAATTDNHRITGITILPGVEAPSAARAPFIMRPFDQELVTCQRYYQKSYNYATSLGTNIPIGINAGTAVATNVVAPGFPFKTRMRIIPTVTFYSVAGTVGSWTGISGGEFPVITAAGLGENGLSTVVANGVNFVVGQGYQGHWTADARM